MFTLERYTVLTLQCSTPKLSKALAKCKIRVIIIVNNNCAHVHNASFTKIYHTLPLKRRKLLARSHGNPGNQAGALALNK